MTQPEDGKNHISKDNAYEILKAFAKEYRKTHKEMPLEIVIVGGGSILLNYGFREVTQDLDVYVNGISGFKDVVYKIADEYNLPNDWMNTDFMKTLSFSDKLRQVSVHYCSFNHGSVEIRTVKDEYLIAMKMMSARGYKSDRSDIIGVLIYAWKDNRRISFGQIQDAIDLLYPENKDKISKEMMQFVKEYSQMEMEDLCLAYMDEAQDEKKINEEIVSLDKKYPGMITEQSVDDVVEAIRKRKAGI